MGATPTTMLLIKTRSFLTLILISHLTKNKTKIFQAVRIRSLPVVHMRSKLQSRIKALHAC